MRFSLLFSSLAAAALLAACPTDDVECESSGECDRADICEDGVCVPNEGVDPDTPQPSTPEPEDGGSSDDGGPATGRPVVTVAWSADGATHSDDIEFAFSIENAESCSAAFGQNGADFHTALVDADSNGIPLYDLDVAVLDALVTGPVVGSVTCDNGAGSTTAEDTFELIADFVTGTFAASAENVATGDTVTLTATFENARTCRLTGPDLDETLTPSTGIVRDTDQALYGTIEVAHDVVVDDDITVQLNCSGARGSDSQSIELRAGGIAAFDVNPAVLIGDEPVFDFTFDVDADACNIDGNNLDLGFNTRDLPYSTNETAVLTCTLGDATFTAETDIAVLSAAELNAPGPIPHDGSITLAAQLYTVGPLPDDIACGVRRPDGTITLLAGNLRNPTPVTNVTEPGTYELLCDNDTDFTDVATPLATVDVVQELAITSFEFVFDDIGPKTLLPEDEDADHPCDVPSVRWTSVGSESCSVAGVFGSANDTLALPTLSAGENELVLTCTGPGGTEERSLFVWEGPLVGTASLDAVGSYGAEVAFGDVTVQDATWPTSLKTVCGLVTLTSDSGEPTTLENAEAIAVQDSAPTSFPALVHGQVRLQNTGDLITSYLVSAPNARVLTVTASSEWVNTSVSVSADSLEHFGFHGFTKTNIDLDSLPASAASVAIELVLNTGQTTLETPRTFSRAHYQIAQAQSLTHVSVASDENTSFSFTGNYALEDLHLTGAAASDISIHYCGSQQTSSGLTLEVDSIESLHMTNTTFRGFQTAEVSQIDDLVLSDNIDLPCSVVDELTMRLQPTSTSWSAPNIAPHCVEGQ